MRDWCPLHRIMIRDRLCFGYPQDRLSQGCSTVKAKRWFNSCSVSSERWQKRQAHSDEQFSTPRKHESWLDLLPFFQNIEYNIESLKMIITSVSRYTRRNKYLVFEDNTLEADRLLFNKAVLTSKRNPTHSQLVFYSIDTDVLVLAIENYNFLLTNKRVSLTSGVVHIGSIWKALGPTRAKALPTFNAFTGDDNTESFSRIRKATWFQTDLQTNEISINALKC